jgi:hypothetical protein
MNKELKLISEAYTSMLQEASEWESRHDEFTRAGQEANDTSINKTLAGLKAISAKASKKRGLINQIVGKNSNGDLSRIAVGADVLHKNISKNKNSKHGTDDRKELGQHMTYANSLLQRHKDLAEETLE